MDFIEEIQNVLSDSFDKCIVSKTIARDGSSGHLERIEPEYLIECHRGRTVRKWEFKEGDLLLLEAQGRLHDKLNELRLYLLENSKQPFYNW